MRAPHRARTASLNGRTCISIRFFFFFFANTSANLEFSGAERSGRWVGSWICRYFHSAMKENTAHQSHEYNNNKQNSLVCCPIITFLQLNTHHICTNYSTCRNVKRIDFALRSTKRPPIILSFRLVSSCRIKIVFANA